MMTDACWLLPLLLLGLAWVGWAVRCRPSSRAGSPMLPAPVQRVLKPRTPNDCPVCHQQGASPPASQACRAVTPWHELKSRRGAPKRIATQGFFCPSRTCMYYCITDAQVHALVGDGRHGMQERIQTFRCQACKTTFSARRQTALYRFKTSSQRVAEVLTALSEGLDVSAAERVFGHRHATITTWLTRAGAHGTTLHAHWLRCLHLSDLQLDALRTRLRLRACIRWLWLAVDPITKLIPVLHVGPRSQDAAHDVIHALCQRLAPNCLPVFTSDGLNLYVYALTAHFGHWVAGMGRTHQWQVAVGLLYGQVKKCYRRRRLVQVIPITRCGTHAALQGALAELGMSGRVNTAFVERVNLTIRQSVAAVTRRTWSTAQAAPQLLAHLEWWRTYYHYVRPHASLRVALVQPSDRGGARIPQRYRQRTPAMAAGLTSRCWTVGELLLVPLPPVPVGVDEGCST